MAVSAAQRETRAEMKLLMTIAAQTDPSVKRELQNAKQAYALAASGIKDAAEREEAVLKGVSQELQRHHLPIYRQLRAEIDKYGSALIANIAVQNKTRKEIREGRKEKEKDFKATEEVITATKNWRTTLVGTIKTLASFSGTLAKVGIGIAAIGATLGVVVVKKVFGILAEGAKKLLNVIGQLAKKTAEWAKSAVEGAIELSSQVQQITVSYQGLTRSEAASIGFLKVLREMALETGLAYTDLAEAGKLLIPFTGGSPEQFERMLSLAGRLQMLRPELGARTAVRALTQFMSGASPQALMRTFMVPKSIIESIKEAGLVGVEALEAIFEQMGYSQELLEGYAGTWKALKEIMRTVGQQFVLGVAAPAFNKLNEQLAKMVDWLRDNEGQVRALGAALGTDLGSAVGEVTNTLFGPEGFSEESLFRIADWGARVIASLAHGILSGISQFLVPAISQITQVIADYLRGTSPPRMGILATVDQWFGPIVRAYLSGFSAADFTALADVGRIIKASLQTAVAMGDITRSDMNKRLLETRGLTVQLIEEFRNFGAVSGATWGKLGEMIGFDTELIQTYLEIVNKVKAAQQALAAAQAAYAAAMKKVKAIQEELRMFELRTAEIPERYKRGRRTEIQLRLMAAQKEARLRQEQVKAAREQLQLAKQQLSAFKQLITALQDLAEAAAKYKEDMEAEEMAGIPEWTDQLVDDALPALEGAFKKLYENIQEYFKPVRDDLEFLWSFFKGLLGIKIEVPGMEMRRRKDGGMPELPEGYAEGEVFRESLEEIAEWLGVKIPEAAKKFTDALVGALETFKEWEEVDYTGLEKVIDTIIRFFTAEDLESARAGWQLFFDILIYEFPKVLDDLVLRLGQWWDEKVPLWLKVLLGFAVPPAAFALEGIETPSLEGIIGYEGVVEEGNQLIQGILDLLFGAKDDTKAAAEEGLRYPLFEVFDEIEEEAVGHSIFPDMMDKIQELFRGLPAKLRSPLQRLVNVIRTYGESAAQWWDYSIKQMEYSLQAFIMQLRYARREIQAYLSMLSQVNQAVNLPPIPTSPGGGGRGGGGRRRQMGGLIRKMEVALLHPGEIVMNAMQQRNVAGQLAMPERGAGEGALNVQVHQRNWTFAGGLTAEERAKLKLMAREGAYEGIHDVFKRAK